MKPSKDISRLIEIMEALRDPQTGCPWDVEQDFKSIAPFTIEEVYEVIDAIERDDRDDLREELGDLLLQVVYHARMAQEEGSFDFGDVVQAVTTKMIRRHPHVFGTQEQRDAGMPKGAWDRIKAEEKREQAQRREAMGLPSKAKGNSRLDDVPPTMPSMMVALKLQQKASKVGFDWNDPKAVLAKIREEIDEAEAELDADNHEALQDEIGDILFAVVNLARHAKLDPDQSLRRSNDKFRKRFAHIEQELGDKIDEADLDTMEAHWQAAKKL